MKSKHGRKKYKSDAHAENETGLAVKEFRGMQDEIRDELTRNLKNYKDPTMVEALMYRTVMEKENSNRLLKTILGKLDKIETRVSTLEKERKPAPPKPHRKMKTTLPEQDEGIMALVKRKGMVCAEDVRTKFKYKGKNAASARLNRLCAAGLLKKQQVGRKVYFQIS